MFSLRVQLIYIINVNNATNYDYTPNDLYKGGMSGYLPSRIPPVKIGFIPHPAIEKGVIPHPAKEKTPYPASRHILPSRIPPLILGLSRIPQRKKHVSRILPNPFKY